MTTTFKTLDGVVILEGVQLPDTFLMIDEKGAATLVSFENGEVTFHPFSADLLAIVEGTTVNGTQIGQKMAHIQDEYEREWSQISLFAMDCCMLRHYELLSELGRRQAAAHGKVLATIETAHELWMLAH